MTKDEIMAMAKQVGIDFEPVVMLCGDVAEFTDMQLSIVRMTRFAELVSVKEREACAQVCDGFDTGRRLTTDHKAAEMAAAIRARGQKEGA